MHGDLLQGINMHLVDEGAEVSTFDKKLNKHMQRA
jgi:hypothetical protein